MSVAEQVRHDMTSAMKSGDRGRAGALRLVLSELQKAAKDGSADELAVLRRERKRRLEAAEQFRAGSRSELADQEESEARLIEGYLPAELGDRELLELIDAAVAALGPDAGPRDLGRAMKDVMARADGRADGRRVSALVKERLALA